jgi:hypothetical protein
LVLERGGVMKGGHRLLAKVELLKAENQKLRLINSVLNEALEQERRVYESSLEALRRSLRRNLERVLRLEGEVES